jgi:hypothetical protein
MGSMGRMKVALMKNYYRGLKDGWLGYYNPARTYGAMKTAYFKGNIQGERMKVRTK